ncbi:hypothetical protein EV356DRAFT_340339 [Viridothelium virens]|uniref:Methyltransferase domain-containing protein n=1 Tax=Viridothelium virens TaxID=1048519 RepID=A0A6A6GXS1_VIRVR|nr:hypothetical protein EV356DRAFT_340339 [Viridothelium virens]
MTIRQWVRYLLALPSKRKASSALHNHQDLQCCCLSTRSTSGHLFFFQHGPGDSRLWQAQRDHRKFVHSALDVPGPNRLLPSASRFTHNSENLKIMGVACGTGIWLIDLSRSLPHAHLDGFEISDAHFPPKLELPKNVTYTML